MARVKRTRFVTQDDVQVERFPWGPHDWLSRPDLVDSEQLLVVRIQIKKGKGCPFHLHPHMEEAVYVLQGVAEQWVGEDVQILRAGEMAHIPKGSVHATFNAGGGVLRLLSILGPAAAEEPALIDVEDQEPWASIRSLGSVDLANKRRVLKKAKKAARAKEVATSSTLKTKRCAAKKARAAKKAGAAKKVSAGKKTVAGRKGGTADDSAQTGKRSSSRSRTSK